MSKKTNQSKKEEETKRSNFIFMYLRDDKVWWGFTLIVVLYSFIIVVPFMQQFNAGLLDDFSSLFGMLSLFILMPIMFMISPVFYHFVNDLKNNE